MARRTDQEKKFSVRGHGADIALFIAAIIVVVFAVVVVLGNKGPAKAVTPSVVGTPAATAKTASAKPKPTPSKMPTAAFIGDSYTTGAGGNGTKWTTLLAQREGWREVNLGYRGTGYGKEFHAPDCPPNGCPDYLQVIDQVVAKKPDIVVVSGGRNDATNIDAAVTNISQIFKQLRSRLPNARIIAISPFWGAGSYPSSLSTIGADVRTAVQSVRGQYVDIGSPLQNKPDTLGSDGVLPTASGYTALATAIETGLKGN